MAVKKMPASSVLERADKIRARDRKAFRMAAAGNISFFEAWRRIADAEDGALTKESIVQRPKPA